MYEWDRVIGSIVSKYLRVGRVFGLTHEDLFSAGRMAAFMAADGWDPDLGRCLSSYVYFCVTRRILRELEVASRDRDLGRELLGWEPVHVPSHERLVQVRLMLSHLQARIDPAYWQLLWSCYVEGRQVGEIAAETGQGPRAVSQKLQRARKKAVTILSRSV